MACLATGPTGSQCTELARNSANSANCASGVNDVHGIALVNGVYIVSRAIFKNGI